MMRAWQMMLVLAPPLQKKRVIALAIVRPFLMQCPARDEMLDAEDDAGSVLPPQECRPPK